jgi:ribokinase
MLPIDVMVVGSYVQDHCWTTERFPAPGETRIGRFATGPGGKGFNQAVAAHKQGVKTCFIGAVGRDALADTARAYAQSLGLPALWEARDDASTAASSIVVDADGQNQIVVALGANERLSPGFVRGHDKLIAGSKVLLTQFETALDAVREALAIARGAGVLTMLNAAPIHDGVTRALFADADVITPNETEFAYFMARLWGKTLPPKYWEIDDGLLHLLCRETGVPTVVLTLGDKGCFVSHDPARRRGDATAFYRLPAERVRAVDTTGAGDAFSGGLAAGLRLFHLDQPFRRAVEHANRVAALSVEQPGTAPAMPTRAEVEARFPTAS